MWVIFLIGAAVGAVLMLVLILLNFKLKTEEAWEEDKRKAAASDAALDKLVAENAQLRLALAVGETDGSGKEDARIVWDLLQILMVIEKNAKKRRAEEGSTLSAVETAFSAGR